MQIDTDRIHIVLNFNRTQLISSHKQKNVQRFENMVGSVQPVASGRFKIYYANNQVATGN